MAGFGGVQEGSTDRLNVAHFADQNNVGILTQGGAKRREKRWRICDLDLALVHVALFVAMQEFDRVFDGDDVFGARWS